MNVYEAHKRLEQIEKYIQTLSRLHADYTNWNEEFGEGNPDAKMIEMLYKEIEKERDTLIAIMESTTIV